MKLPEQESAGYNTKFHLYSLKVSANVKIATQCFDFFGGDAPKFPPGCAPDVKVLAK